MLRFVVNQSWDVRFCSSIVSQNFNALVLAKKLFDVNVELTFKVESILDTVLIILLDQIIYLN